VIFSWTGEVLEQSEGEIVVLALWTTRQKPMLLGYTVFEHGDSFVEHYYWGKWYSIWEVRSHRNGRVKGWYCTICRPIEVEDDQLRFVDMELDVYVYPDGRFVILDEDELLASGLPESEQDAARAGLAEVVGMITERQAPFERIGPPRRVEPFWDPPPPRR
jgi:predicted RNA-binding protein associated with RNAse of E/G family